MSWQQNVMQFCKCSCEYINWSSWLILFPKQLFTMLKIAPTQNEQQESSSLLVRPLKPPKSHWRRLSHRVSLARSISCRRPSTLKVAIPQKVYPPCAQPPSILESPPSQVCAARIVSATPSSSCQSRCSSLTMMVTIYAARRSVSAPLVIWNRPPILQVLKNLVRPYRSSKWQALGPMLRMVRKAEQVGARCGNCMQPPPKPPHCTFQQQRMALVILASMSSGSSIFIWMRVLTIQQQIQGCPQSKCMIALPMCISIIFMYYPCCCFRRQLVQFMSTFLSASTTYFSQFVVQVIGLYVAIGIYG